MTTTSMVGSGRAVGAHRDAAQSSRDELAWRWIRQGKLWLLPLLLSDYGREILERKYDAIATDHAYDVRPSGRLGPIGAFVDWVVLQQDIHVALRQRLALVVDELDDAVRDQWARGHEQVLLASGPCGLARDLRLAWASLGEPRGRLELLGLDLDGTGEVLPLARQRAAAAGVPLATARCDLLDLAAVRDALGGRRAQVLLCIGLTVWLDPPDLEQLLRTLRATLDDGGTLIVDNFRAHRASLFARDREMKTRYHDQALFAAALRQAGFVVEAARETRNRVDVVYRCRVGG